jgi:hypothetical protein
MALSIASKGSSSQASAAASTIACGVSTTRMRFSVRVPVLSTHSTVAAPSISIAGMRRVSTPRREMRHAPRARNTVRTTGNSSGMIAMASVSPASRLSSQPPRRRKCAAIRAAESPSAKAATSLTTRAVSRSSEVLPLSRVASDTPMRPSSLLTPVASTTARPSPFTTSVPEYTASPARFVTGSDSPVSSDSSSSRSSASSSRASAATRSPSATISRSPRTTSRPAMRRRSPSRITSARGLDRSRSASSARSALCSCTTVIATTTTIDAASTSASCTSPTRT